MNKTIILLLCIIYCTTNKITAQNAQCSYENSYRDKFNLVTYNTYFYTCFLNTQQSNFNTPISNVVGRHGSGYTDNHVTYLQTSKGSKMRKFSSVYCQKFQNLISIYAYDADIESIDESALKSCRNLEIFAMEYSVMQQVPQNLLINNLKLKVLTFLRNWLTTLPGNFLVNQRELLFLGITQSRLSSLPKTIFNSLYKLQVLYLDSNKLQTIVPDWFTNLQSLRLLSMSSNQITNIPKNAFKGTRNLEKILIASNKISFLDSHCFDGLYSLKKLNLGMNEITDLPAGVFSQLRSLETLELSQNKITAIHSDSFGSHSNLKTMEFQQNKINSFDEKVISTTPVTSINLSHNICSQYILNRSNMKTHMKTCFSNHRQRGALKPQSTWTSKAAVKTTTAYRAYSPKSTLKRYTTSKAVNSWANYKPATTKAPTRWTTTPKATTTTTKTTSTSRVTTTTTSTPKTTVSTTTPKPTTTTTTSVPETSTVKSYYKDKGHVDYNNKVQECGRPMIGQGNIIGGQHAFRGDYPWTAALLKSEAYFCGGVLVSNRKVVTAAHCMQEKQVREPLRSQDIVVLLGAYDLNIHHEAGRSIFAVQKVEIHPDWLYQAVQYDADIAVLVLIGQVSFPPFIQPICLITTQSVAEIMNGIAVGYGKSENESKKHENIPNVIDTPIYTNQECFNSNQYLAAISSGRTFCGGLGKGVGVCKGDSGGGVFVMAANVYYLRGIVSSSLRAANMECDVDNYSVFTNVLKFNDWIEETTTEI